MVNVFNAANAVAEYYCYYIIIINVKVILWQMTQVQSLYSSF